jgi:hypothetical protein
MPPFVCCSCWAVPELFNEAVSVTCFVYLTLYIVVLLLTMFYKLLRLFSAVVPLLWLFSEELSNTDVMPIYIIV